MTRALVAVAVVFGILTVGVPVASALFSGGAAVDANGFTTDELDPPTGLSANSSLLSIQLNWTPTVDTYAEGYRIFRSTSSGGPYTQIDEVLGRSTSSYTDSLLLLGTFFYVVRSFYEQWESVNSGETSATLP